MSRRAPNVPRCAHCDTTRGRLVETPLGLRCTMCFDRMPSGQRRRLRRNTKKPDR